MAYLITPAGVREQRKPKDGRSFTLEELQELVGGYVEVLPGTRFVLVDEDGLIKRLPHNPLASQFVAWRGPLVGNVLICEEGEVS